MKYLQVVCKYTKFNSLRIAISQSTLYTGLSMSKLDACCQSRAWDSLRVLNIQFLELPLVLGCILIEKARLKDNWSHNWLTVEQLTKFDRSVMTYKIISRQCPESLWDKYHYRTQHSNYRTRNCRDLQIPRNNLEYVKKGFHYSALKAWNDIPINIRELPTLSKFKKQLKSYYSC